LDKSTFKVNAGYIIIIWKMVNYPKSLINENMSQNTKDKKKDIIIDKRLKIILLKIINYILPDSERKII